MGHKTVFEECVVYYSQSTCGSSIAEAIAFVRRVSKLLQSSSLWEAPLLPASSLIYFNFHRPFNCEIISVIVGNELDRKHLPTEAINLESTIAIHLCRGTSSLMISLLTKIKSYMFLSN